MIDLHPVPPIPAGMAIPEADWRATHPEIRSEIIRMQKELSAGIERYRPASERDATMTEWHDYAARSGKTLRHAIREFVGMEHLLRTDTVGGLELLAKKAGVNLADVLAQALEADEAVA